MSDETMSYDEALRGPLPIIQPTDELRARLAAAGLHMGDFRTRWHPTKPGRLLLEYIEHESEHPPAEHAERGT